MFSFVKSNSISNKFGNNHFKLNNIKILLMISLCSNKKNSLLILLFLFNINFNFFIFSNLSLNINTSKGIFNVLSVFNSLKQYLLFIFLSKYILLLNSLGLLITRLILELPSWVVSFENKKLLLVSLLSSIFSMYINDDALISFLSLYFSKIPVILLDFSSIYFIKSSFFLNLSFFIFLNIPDNITDNISFISLVKIKF